jgi:serine/threonine-protein phosphatase CPPED1
VHFNPPVIGNEQILNQTMRMIAVANPDFVLLTGDLITGFNDTEANLKRVESNLKRFYEILYSFNFSIPIYFVNGNHEKESLGGLQLAVLYMGSNQTFIKSNQNIEYPISFKYSDYSFFGFDSSVYPFQSGGGISDSQYIWLQDQLNASSGKKIIAFSHHPTNSNTSMNERVDDLLEQYHVQAAFSGHLHTNEITENNGVTYFVTTSALNDTHWSANPPYLAAGYRTVKIVNDSISSAYVANTFSYDSGEFIGGGFPTYPTAQNGTMTFATSQPYNSAFDNAVRVDAKNTTWAGFWFFKGVGLYVQNCDATVNNFMENSILNVSFSCAGTFKIYNSLNRPRVYGAENIYQDNITTVYVSQASTVIMDYSVETSGSDSLAPNFSFESGSGPLASGWDYQHRVTHNFIVLMRIASSGLIATIHMLIARII